MDSNKIKEIVQKFSHKKIAVIGDYYLDEYFHCNAKSFSPEAPVPRAIVNKIEHVPGCAGNVAMAFKHLGAHVFAIGVVGPDEKGHILRNALINSSINTTNLVVDSERLTGTFSRIILGSATDTLNQHFIRFDQENKAGISQNTQQKIMDQLQSCIQKVDLIFIADYDEANKQGIVTNNMIEKITNLAKQHAVPTMGLSRENIHTFSNADTLLCNKKELKSATNMPTNSEDELIQAAKQLLLKTNSSEIVTTLGKEGMMVLDKSHNYEFLPSVAKTVVDVCGAGDALSAMYGLCSTLQLQTVTKGTLASYAAAIAISKMGTASVTHDEIIDLAAEQNPESSKIILDLQELTNKVLRYKQEGKKIVFTNGFFDVFHSGHVHLLQEARKHGDILIVAINSDRSTKENKGEHRPFLSQDERLKILSSLDCLDHAIVFDELTPVKIISSLQPDIVAKGGNFSVDQVIGKDIIEKYGGIIKIIPLNETTNTKSLLERISSAKEL